MLGGVLYASLRVGPWSIERRERLQRLRDLAADESSNPESAFDFSVRFTRRAGPASDRRPPTDVRPSPATAADAIDDAWR